MHMILAAERWAEANSYVLLRRAADREPSHSSCATAITMLSKGHRGNLRN